MNDELSFDRWQFDDIRARPVTKESNITWEDYGRMGQQDLSDSQDNRRPVPTWTQNNECVRRVICSYMAGFLHQTAPLTTLADLRMADEMAVQILRSSPSQEFKKRLAAVEKAGSYSALAVNIIYLAYRSHYSSVEISKETGLMPGAVRASLMRLNNYARELFPELCAPRAKIAGRKWPLERKIHRRWPAMPDCQVKRLAKGLCRYCGANPHLPEKTLCEKCHAECLTESKAAHQRAKLRAQGCTVKTSGAA